MAKTIGNDTIHRIVKDDDKEFVLHTKSTKSSFINSYDTLYLSSFPAGFVKKSHFQYMGSRLFKHLGLILGVMGIALAIASFTVFAHTAVVGVIALIVGGTLFFIGIMDLVQRVDGSSITEEWFDFDSVSYVPGSARVPNNYDGNDSRSIKYLNSLSDKEFAAIAQNLDKWTKVEKAHRDLTNELNQRNSGVDKEFLDFVQTKKQELEAKMVEVEAGRSLFTQNVNRASSEGKLLKVMKDAESALAS